MKNNLLVAVVVAATVALTGCGSSSSNKGDDSSSSEPTGGASSSAPTSSTSTSSSDSSSSTGDMLQDVFSFKNENDESTVSYSGQIARHVIMDEIKQAIGNVTSQDMTQLEIAKRFYFGGESQADIDEFFITTAKSPNTIQKTIGAISTGKNLSEKIAGGFPEGNLRKGESARLINDEFFGWEGLAADDKPDEFVNYLFDQIEALIVEENLPTVPVDGEASGVAIAKRFVSAEGVDYQQLVQKFLLMSVGFSQGTNDYLAPGRDFTTELGILVKDGVPNLYSEGEHHFDEGFGYFGGARDSLNLTKDQIKALHNDSNEDGMIDLNSEYNYGQSVNCAKRERGNNNFTERAMRGFIDGRGIVAKMTAEKDSLTDTQKEMYKADLANAISAAAIAWEECIAATVIHYINVLTDDDMSQYVDGQFASIGNFYDVAKHWSEMKGFALGLQFSPYSPFRADDRSLAQLKDILQKMGTAPVLANDTADNIAQYTMDLMDVRAVLKDIYDFSQDNVEAW